MRAQYCREHLTDEVVEACGLSRQTRDEVRQVTRFVELHADFSALPTKPILTLIRIKEPEVKARVIASVTKALETKKHPITGKHLIKGRITEADVKQVIAQKDRELRLELQAESRDTHEQQDISINEVQRLMEREITTDGASIEYGHWVKELQQNNTEIAKLQKRNKELEDNIWKYEVKEQTVTLDAKAQLLNGRGKKPVPDETERMPEKDKNKQSVPPVIGKVPLDVPA